MVSKSIENNIPASKLFTELMFNSKDYYHRLQELGIKNEDARYVLSQGSHTARSGLQSSADIYASACSIRDSGSTSSGSVTISDISRQRIELKF
jgi:hypothetical protein